MLRRNLSVSENLVNGRMGTIESINYDSANTVSSIDVLFDNNDKTTRIERVKADFEISSNIFATRCQFPLILGLLFFKRNG